jgi:DNA-binding MarR family transcriptional regulator
MSQYTDTSVSCRSRSTASSGRLAAGSVHSSGQTLARWVALNAACEGPATVAEISRRFGLARQSVQRVADLLVEDGLAVYQDNPRHRRAKLLVPTPRGREVALEINTRQKAWADALGARIGEAELVRASESLERVMRAMRDEAG